MGDTPFGNIFGQDNFPNLYPQNLQDETNEYYNHNKVLPRVEGRDYTDKEVYPDSPESKSTFPHQY